jgi:TolA-binding protein
MPVWGGPMEKLIEQAPKIIEAAAKSPLGLLALMILALSILAFLFFRKAALRLRVSMFMVVFLGFVFLGAALYQVTTTDKSFTAGPNAPTSPRGITIGRVLKQEHLPPLGNPDDEKELFLWLNNFFEAAQIFIDKGSLDGVRTGDYFVAVNETEIKDERGKVIGTVQEEGSTLRVAVVDSKFSIAQLNEFAYRQYSKDLQSREAQMGATARTNNNAEFYSPVAVGQKVVGLPLEERAQWKELSQLYERTLSKEATDEENQRRYQEIVDKAEEFISEHGNGCFAPRALFDKGYAQFKLKQYRASIRTFELFLDRYPFHVSASGARKTIEEVKDAIIKEGKVLN